MEETIDITIAIPNNLYKKIVEKTQEAGFNNIEEFILFILEQVIESA